MKNSAIGLVALGALSLTLAACSGNSSVNLTGRGTGAPAGLATPLPGNPPRSTSSYVQVELLARPAVKEVFENFNDHKTTNAVEPYAGSPADPLQAEIKATEDTVRPPSSSAGTDYGAAIQGVLYPNELAVNLSDTTSQATYLGVETKGATGGTFGGRDTNNDVVGASLGVIFGNTLSALNLIKDDGEENNCLSTENLPTPRASQTRTNTFPYLASPH